jgi:adenylate cyclase
LGVTVLVLLLLVAALYPDTRGLHGLRLSLFDSYQRTFPRQQLSAPVVIVAIDEASLQRYGQWPWPRTFLARLLDGIGRHRPAAIGIDLLLPEPDRLSPDQLALSLTHASPALRRELSRLPANDALLAGTVKRLPVVLGMAGLDSAVPSATPPRTAPFLAQQDASEHVRTFSGVLRSLEPIDAASPGHGLISIDAPDGVVRRVPMLASIDGLLVPALTMDMLRVAGGESGFTLDAGPDGLRAMRVGDLAVPVDADGNLWLHFGRAVGGRFVSAAAVLEGAVEPAQLERKLVLVGFTGLGLLDFQATPLGQRLAGVEIHAQVLENVFDGRLLRRPAWAAQAERVVLVACGTLLIVLVPALRPRASLALYTVLVALLLGVGFALFRGQGLVLDAALPVLGATLVYGALLAGTLADADLHQRQLTRALARERQTAERLSGELEAARRIQLGILPPASGDFYQDPRFSLHALTEPAREVGGDLYDFFKPDADRLFVLIGDVSGKGLPASLFMAVSKALYKSLALRAAGEREAVDAGALMQAANAELSRENPATLFVTAFGGVLNLRTGHLEYCNAGHDIPSTLAPGRATLGRLEDAWGPPLCAMEGFRYTAAGYDLQPGETLVLVTDGVPEAMDAGKSLYGRERLARLLAALSPAQEVSAITTAVRDDVRAFEGQAERSDDLTVLVLRWNCA